MTATEQGRCDKLYHLHLRTLNLRGMSDNTIDSYARAVRRITSHFDCCPDQLTTEQLESYFAELVASHSWSTVKLDRNGLQFFWRYVLKAEVDIIKVPTIHTLPDILTLNEVERLILATRQLRYRAFILTTYSMGLRLSETLSLQVGDIAYRDVGKGRELGAEALMPSVSKSIFAGAKAIKIVWYPCLT